MANEPPSKICDNCRYFEVTGTADGGIKAYRGHGTWIYEIGKCTHAPHLGTSAGKEGLACFTRCFLFKLKKGKKRHGGRQ